MRCSKCIYQAASLDSATNAIYSTGGDLQTETFQDRNYQSCQFRALYTWFARNV